MFLFAEALLRAASSSKVVPPGPSSLAVRRSIFLLLEKKTRARFAYTAKGSRIPVVLPRTHGAGLLVLSPGVGRGHAASLDRGARALAGAGVRRLLLREPSLDAEEVWRLARGLLLSLIHI